jgi:uncharacterized protein (DUF2252 family)
MSQTSEATRTTARQPAAGQRTTPRQRTTGQRPAAQHTGTRPGPAGSRTTGSRTTGTRTTGSRTTGSRTRSRTAGTQTAGTAARRPATRKAAARKTTADKAATARAAAGKAPAGKAATRTPAAGTAATAAKTAAARADRLSPAERAALGKAVRTRVPRESHAGFEPAAGRPDPVALLEEQGRSRVPGLVPVRYGRMLASPFSYYRGAALPMAADLAHTPCSGLQVQACGDAHLSNFGLFGTPERRLVFDVNDFDETLPGPWEWDVKRLAASLEVAGRDNGYDPKDRRKVVQAAVGEYRKAMRKFAAMTNLEVWYAAGDVEQMRAQFADQLKARQRKAVTAAMDKALTRDSTKALSKLARPVDGQLRIISEPPLIVPVRDLLADQQESAGYESLLEGLIGKYRRTLETDRRILMEQYQFTDMARKVVGVGSVGTRCWIILMMGRDRSDPLFLQVKEAQESVLSRYGRGGRFASEGERVVAGQRLMQAASDLFLGYVQAAGVDGVARDFYVRQLRDWKFSLPIEAMVPRGMRLYARLCGWSLARAHARSGDRIAIGSYLGGSAVFDRAIADFAASYADQNQRDYEALQRAADTGRIAVQRGV